MASLNAFESAMAALNQIDQILMTDTRTIAQFLSNRRIHLLKNRDTSIKGKRVGFMDRASMRVKAVLILTKCIKIGSKTELNQNKHYLNGLGIKSIDEIAPKLHQFGSSIYLWQFSLFALVDKNCIISPKDTQRISKTIWASKNKLSIKAGTNSIFYVFARLIAQTPNMPSFDISTSPFYISRTSAFWPSSVRSSISSKHAIIRHDFGKNTTSIQRMSKVNDMAINDSEPVLKLHEIAQIANNDTVEIITGVVYKFKLLQSSQWNNSIPDFLRPQVHKQPNLTPPPPQSQRSKYEKRRRHRSPPLKSTHINQKLNFSADYVLRTE